MKKTVSIKNLYPGQKVEIMNCSGIFEIIKRVEKNLYQVDFKGNLVTVQRSVIAVNVFGIYRLGAFNETK